MRPKRIVAQDRIQLIVCFEKVSRRLTHQKVVAPTEILTEPGNVASSLNVGSTSIGSFCWLLLLSAIEDEGSTTSSSLSLLVLVLSAAWCAKETTGGEVELRGGKIPLAAACVSRGEESVACYNNNNNNNGNDNVKRALNYRPQLNLIQMVYTDRLVGAR